jgi:MFS family permease
MTAPADGTGPGLDRLPIALAACFGLAAATMTTFPVVAPEVVSELGLSYAETGVITAAYMLGYGLFQLPASFLGIRLGSGRVLLGTMALMSVGALLPLLDRPSAWVASRFVLGIAGAAVLPLSVHLLTQAMTGARLVKGLGVAISGWGAGMSVAMLGAAPLLRLAGWRAVMLAAAVLGLLVAAGLNRALPPRSRIGDRAGGTPRPAQLLRQFGTNRALNGMSVINAAGTSMLICVSGWLPLYISRAFGTPADEISATLSPLGLGIAFGAWVGGALTIRFGWKRVVIASMVASGLLVASIPLQSSAILIVATAIVIGWVAMFFAAPTQSLFPFVIAEDWTALAAGYYNTIGFFGAFAASLLFGFLADRAGDFAAGWLSLSAISVIGILAVLAVPIPALVHSLPRAETAPVAPHARVP